MTEYHVSNPNQEVEVSEEMQPNIKSLLATLPDPMRDTIIVNSRPVDYESFQHWLERLVVPDRQIRVSEGMTGIHIYVY